MEINHQTMNPKNVDTEQTRAYGRRVLAEKMSQRHTDHGARTAARRIIMRLRELR